MILRVPCYRYPLSVAILKCNDTADLLERSIEIGIATKASGVDVIFIACADMNGSLLITADRKMHERARQSGIDTLLLWEWLAGAD